jgi:SPP1 gp7 family putative phage head morphogenesis protein
MNLYDSFKSLFRGSVPDEDTQGSSAPIHEQEEAWGTSLLYSGEQFPEYNPDSLVGRKGLGVYKLMMNDEQCKSVVRFRRNATTGRKFKFVEPETDKLSDEEKQFRVRLFNNIVDQMPGVFKSKLDGIMSGMQFGFSLTEKVYGQIEFEDKVWYGIESLNTKQASSFEFYLDIYGNLVKLNQHISGNEQTLDIDNFIHFVQNSDVHRYYGQSELREAYRAYYSKDIATRLHNMWLERMAGGFTWATPMKGKTLQIGSTEYNSLKNALSSIRNNTAIITPSGIEINVEHPSDSQAFERAIGMHDKAIAKSLLVPNLLGLSEQGSTGSYAQSKTQLEAFLWDLDSEARYLEETLNEQLFKQIGDINFDDGMYPKFAFNKLSFEQIKGIVEMWNSLTGSSVVTSTLEDENILRGLIEMPERQEEQADDGDIIEITKQDTALNGAQVTSMLGITVNVAEGLLAKEAAIQMLITAYPITIDRAKSIIDPIEVDKTLRKDNGFDNGGNPEVTYPGDKDAGINRDSINNGDAETGKDKAKEKDKKANEEKAKDKFSLHRSASIRRVDFSTIDRSSEVVSTTNTLELSEAVTKTVNDLIETYVNTFDFSDPDMKVISSMKVSSDNKRNIKNTISTTLKDGWKLGQLHADLEIKKALGDKRHLMSKVNFASIEDLAVKYFNTQSFNIAGDITDKSLSIVRQEIMNGIQYTKTRDEVTQSIYDRFVKDGMVPPGEVPESFLNELLAGVSPAHRIETIVRTNTFTAINEGRIAYFEDPTLDGFVEAYEYSAILDGRTTSICNSLGDADTPQIHAVGDPVWDEIKPPNHFNCRALLIPIIQGDVWAESAPPEVSPADGFK